MSEGALHVLYVEDDEAVRSAGVQTFELADLPVTAVVSAEAAAKLLRPDAPCVLLTDVRLPGRSGMELLHEVVLRDPDLPVILVTGHGDVAMAVEAMRAGAYDFIEKPYAADRLVEVVRRALEKRRLVLENRALRARLEDETNTLLLGDSPAMRRVRDVIRQVADADVDVLVLGETGTGKECVAQALHQGSARRHGHFVAINCAALPESVFESEMFGAEQGAFTGAMKRRIGKIEHADRGTLFLDEIEGMPLALQAKLLRVLQERSVERLGGNAAIPVDCRVVAATKVDLKAASDAGQFRLDLYYRLNVVTVALPPLRERREDIPLLFTHFLKRAAERFNRPVPPLDGTLLAKLSAQDWPGNVRELQHAAERQVLGLGVEATQAVAGQGAFAERVDAFERQILADALRAASGSVTTACEQLGLPRKTLYDKLARHGLDPKAFRAG